MCEELNNEVDSGRHLALELIKHLENMGATQCDIPIESNGIGYSIKIIQVKKVDPAMEQSKQKITEAEEGETTLIFKRVGRYSMTQSDFEDDCCVCRNAKYGDVLVRIADLEENERYICVGCLMRNWYKEV